MGWQVRRFSDLIDKTRRGDQGAENALRHMIELSSRSAPRAAIVRIAETVLDLGKELHAAEELDVLESL